MVAILSLRIVLWVCVSGGKTFKNMTPLAESEALLRATYKKNLFFVGNVSDSINLCGSNVIQFFLWKNE